MVSIRKKSSRGALASVFTLTNAILLFITFQVVSLLLKASRQAATNTGKDGKHSPLRSSNLQKFEHSKASNKIHIEKIHDGHPHAKVENVHSDHDDHVLVDPDEQKLPNEPLPNVAHKDAADNKAHVGIDPETAQVLKRHGSGPTQYGFVVDMIQERAHAPFRNGPLPDFDNRAQLVASLLGKKSVSSCEYLANRRLQLRQRCRDTDTVLFAYNGAEFPRTLCGTTIAPHSVVTLSEHCREPAYVFPQDSPPVSGHGMPPIIVQSQASGTATNLDNIECDISCQWERDYDGVEHFIAGTGWKLIVSETDPATNAQARIERLNFHNDIYYSTVSFKSSVPLSFYNFEKYSLRNRPAIDWGVAGNKATYTLNKDCNSFGSIRRQKWSAAVKSAFPLEAYGVCEHNTELGPGETLDTLEGRIQLARKNRIHLVLEATSEKDYMTDLTWEALLSGAVPALMTASNANNILPPNAAIYASMYNNWDKFAEYIKQVSENVELWESYHAWRNDENALAEFERKFNFTRTSPQCRTCRWAYAKMYGLGWDHDQQLVRANHISRRLCVQGDKKLVSKPFRELWTGKGKYGSDTNAQESCPNLPSETNIELDGYKLSRTVSHHDGVVDLAIQFTEKSKAHEDVTLRMVFNVRNTDGAYFRDTHTLVSTERSALVSSASIQDELSKVTVIADWETLIMSPEEGVIQITIYSGDDVIDEDDIRKIRVIVEDFGLHDKLTEFYPSSYGKTMTRDFIDPIELFYVDS